jgi:GntR family transcriptional regulator/MocR family aminotransferase
VVAAFMQKGHFARHIRRMRMLYADRRRALASALEAAFGARVMVEMAGGGMHLLAGFSGGSDDVALGKRAAAAGMAPSTLSSHTMAHDRGQGLLLSFTNIPVEAAPNMAMRLKAALGPLADLTVAPQACDAALSLEAADEASDVNSFPFCKPLLSP